MRDLWRVPAHVSINHSFISHGIFSFHLLASIYGYWFSTRKWAVTLSWKPLTVKRSRFFHFIIHFYADPWLVFSFIISWRFYRLVNDHWMFVENLSSDDSSFFFSFLIFLLMDYWLSVLGFTDELLCVSFSRCFYFFFFLPALNRCLFSIGWSMLRCQAFMVIGFQQENEL